MPTGDAWDWPTLLYIGTVILRRSEREFWRMTPRKLNALAAVHVELHSGGKTKHNGEDVQYGYIDQIF